MRYGYIPRYDSLMRDFWADRLYRIEYPQTRYPLNYKIYIKDIKINDI